MKKIPILYGLMAIMAVGSCTGEFDFSREEVTALKVEQRVVAFGNEASSKTLAVSSDAEWTVSKDASADWLEDNEVTTGTTFEAKFKFAYELVENGGHILGGIPKDIYQVKLIMLEGIRVVKKESSQSPKNKSSIDKSSLIQFEEDIDNLPQGVLELLQRLASRLNDE